MAVRGKWGITRDRNGELALIWAWPWYWRYPFAVAVIALAWWIGLSKSGQGPEWLVWTCLIGGPVIALSITYELGCLAVCVGAIWGLWALVSPFLPWGQAKAPVELWLALLGAFAYYVWYTGDQTRSLAARNQRAIDNIWSRLNQIEEDAKHFRAEQWCEIDRLREEAKRLRDPSSNGFDGTNFP